MEQTNLAALLGIHKVNPNVNEFCIFLPMEIAWLLRHPGELGRWKEFPENRPKCLPFTTLDGMRFREAQAQAKAAVSYLSGKGYLRQASPSCPFHLAVTAKGIDYIEGEIESLRADAKWKQRERIGF